MKAFVPLILISGMMSGCSFLGYYKREKAERAPPEEAAMIKFPDSLEGGVHLTGPMAAALETAMNEFLPPGKELKTNDPDERVAACLSRRSTYETLVLSASDDLFFVAFIPALKRCGLDEEILDGGAVYAVDGKGRILGMR
jgi:hypothetical protein